MSQTHESPLRDERLVDLLEEALSAIKTGQSLDSLGWRQSYPDLSEEAPGLLATLSSLSEAAEDWGTGQKPTGTEDEVPAGDLDRQTDSAAEQDTPPPEPEPERVPVQIGRYQVQ